MPQPIRHTLTFLLLLAVAGGTAIRAQELVPTGRYTAVPAVPTDAQRDPLAAIVTIAFPGDVETVGQALRLALADTGYVLEDALHWDIEVFALVEYPLPGAQRALGPLSVFDLLRTLIGPAFDIAIDRASRTVAFERHDPPPVAVDPPAVVVDPANPRRRR